MNRTLTLTSRLIILALLLAFGPLQATATFACEMMDTVVEEVCCCDDGPAAPGNAGSEEDCSGAMSAMASVPCCEHSATVGIDAESFKATSAFKSGNKVSATQSDLDPPDTGLIDALVAPELLAFPPDTAAPPVAFNRRGDGTTLWLTTRRLRL